MTIAGSLVLPAFCLCCNDSTTKKMFSFDDNSGVYTSLNKVYT